MGLPVEFVRQWTTSSQFMDWIDYFELEQNTVSKDQYYLANIAKTVDEGMRNLSYLIQCFMSKKAMAVPKQGKIEDYVLKFHRDKKAQKKEAKKVLRKWSGELDEKQVEQKTQQTYKKLDDSVIESMEEYEQRKKDFLRLCYAKMSAITGIKKTPESRE